MGIFKWRLDGETGKPVVLSSSRGHCCLALELADSPSLAQGEITPELWLLSEQSLARRERTTEALERVDRDGRLWPRAGRMSRAGGQGSCSSQAVPSWASGQVVGAQGGRSSSQGGVARRLPELSAGAGSSRGLSPALPLPHLAAAVKPSLLGRASLSGPDCRETSYH